MLPRDFLPVASLIDQPMFICASATSGIKTLPDLIARAKQNPNQISFAATGIGRRSGAIRRTPSVSVPGPPW